MKNRKLLFGILFIGLFASSCYTEVIVEDDFIEESPINTALVLESHDLWYVDINETRGNGEVPFCNERSPFPLIEESFMPTTIFQDWAKRATDWE